MPKEFKNKDYWWYIPGRCKVCKIHIRSAASSHENSDKHKNNERNYRTECTINQLKRQNEEKIEPFLSAKTFSFYLNSTHPGLAIGSESQKAKCLWIINKIMAPHFHQILEEDVGTKPFSLLFDEVHGSDITKMMGIIIRYYSGKSKKFISTFLKIAKLEKLTDSIDDAQIIARVIENTAKEFNLELSNLVGIATHNDTKKMQKRNEAVFECLKDRNQSIFYPILCTCHSMLKAFSQAARESFPSELECLVRETYEWFNKQPDRRLIYKTLCGALNVEQILRSNLQINGILWLSRYEAVEKIMSNWESLEEHFRIAKDHKDDFKTAKYLYSIYRDPYNHVYLSIIQYNLKFVTEINKAFENSSLDAIEILKRLGDLKNAVLTGCVEENFLFDDNTKKIIEEELIQEDTSSIVDRHYKPFLNNFKKKLDLLYCKNQGSEQYDKIIQMLEKIKSKLTSIRKLPSDSGIESRNITHALSHTTNLQKSWEAIFERKDASSEANPSQKISDLAMRCLSLPFSDIDVKRIFRQMYFIEMRKISGQKLNTFNNILMIRNTLKLMNTNYEEYQFSESIIKRIKNAFTDDSSTTGMRHDFNGCALNGEEENILLSIKQTELEYE